MIGIFCKGLLDGRFPNLVDLEPISSSSESNEKLFAKAKVPKLESVKLSYHRDCRSVDVRLLATKSSLKCLDLTNNLLTDTLSLLLLQQYLMLKTLVVSGCNLSRGDLRF